MNVIRWEFYEMWAKLIVSVTLLPVLVHSIFGCCWHHAHSQVKLHCIHSAGESSSCSRQPHGHRHSHDHRSEETSPVVPEPCEHDGSCHDARCVYLASESVRNTLVFSLSHPFSAFNPGCIANLKPVTRLWQDSQHSEDVPLPSQRCALTQVWVV